MVLPALILLTQIVKEFYPFSHFPMYSNPTDQPSVVVYAVDADERAKDGGYLPVSMERVFGVRAASTKKRLYSNIKNRAKDLGIDKEDLPEEELSEIASDLLEYLRRQARKIGKEDQLPPRLALVHGEIHAEIGIKLHRVDEIIAEEETQTP